MQYLTPEADSEVFNEVGDSVMNAVRQYIDQRAAKTGEDRRLLAAVAGKALMISGSTFIANAMGITDPDVGMKPGMEALEKFKQYALDGKSGK